MGFSFFDILVVVIILIIGLRGFINGFIKEIFSLLGLVGGVFLASRFAQNIGKIINENIYTMQNEAAVQVVGFVVILLFFWFLCFITGLVISKLVVLGGLTNLNKFFGFVFNCLKMFLIFSIIIFALSNITVIKDKLDGALNSSFMYKTFLSVGSKILDMKVQSVSDTVYQITDDVQEVILDDVDDIINSISDDINITINSEQ
ncbi:MAG: CvpA family protein [Campylobacteraceae bacterium]|jgi:membrane protein required for colicin V production|nr:CvpA family protein [Campylobacteraceae bacterium]